MGWLSDMELKGCESIKCWTHVMTFNVHFTHDLDLGSSRSNFENAVSQEWDRRLTWNKRKWVNRMLHPLCDFQVWPQPWHWPWIFKVKFWKKSYLRNGMADWHGMKWMWVNRILDSCCDFQLSPHPWPWPWISRSNFEKSYLRNGMADWHGTKGMSVDRMLDPCCDFQCSPLPWPWPWISRSNFEKVVSQEWDVRLTWNGRDVSR